MAAETPENSSGAQGIQVTLALLTATVKTHLGDGANPGTIHGEIGKLSQQIAALRRIVTGDEDGGSGLKHQINALNAALADIARIRERLIDGVGGKPSIEMRLDRIEVQAEKSSKIQTALMVAAIGAAVKFIVDALAHHV